MRSSRSAESCPSVKMSAGSEPWSAIGVLRKTPQLGGFVVAGGGEQPTVWAERHAIHLAGVSDLEQLGAGAGVPDPRGLVAAGGGEQPAVRAERHARHLVGVGDLEQLGAGAGVPDPRGAVVAGGGEPSARWVEGDIEYVGAPAAGSYPELLSARQVYHQGLPSVTGERQAVAVRAEGDRVHALRGADRCLHDRLADVRCGAGQLAACPVSELRGVLIAGLGLTDSD